VAAEGVEEDPEREREDALRDPEGESGGGAGEVALEPQLLLEVGEDALDDQPGGGESALARFVRGGASLLGCE
jgi:hypothetical protein